MIFMRLPDGASIMIAITQKKRQQALAAALRHIRAKAEGGELSDDEVEALTEALATITRDINLANDLTAVPTASDDACRGHALARGPPSGESLLRWREVARRVGLSRSQIWKRVRRKEFPEPI